MDKQTYESVISDFNVVLIKHFPKPIIHNYVRNSSVSSFIYVKVDLTENCHKPELSAENCLESSDVEFTVHYDPFYRVPVLSYRMNLVVNANPHCAMDIHPILHSPYLYLHPCETETTMASIPYENGLDYLVKWIGIAFSLVLPELQPRIALEKRV